MTLSLLDWRRRVAALYGEVRATPDAAAAHARWRRGREDLMRSHPDSPIPARARAGFEGLAVEPYDPTLRWELELDTGTEAVSFETVTGTDGVVGFRRIGVVHLPDLGDLDVWWLRSYGGGLFLPMKDATAGTASYGGGRYLLDTAKGADLGGSGGRLVVDLNFAYNPSCAYDPGWACPLAPPGNVLAVPVRAGEMAPPREARA